MTGPGEPYVFISYAREDLAVAAKIVRTLQGLGLDCWFDQRSLFGGQRFGTEIEGGIERAAALIFVQSPHALASAWCAREVDHAIACDIPVIPALVAPVDSTQAPVADLHWVDFTDHADRDRFDQAIHLLVQALAVHAALSDADALVAAAARRTGAEQVAARLEDIEQTVRATEAFLYRIDETAPDRLPPWSDSDRKGTSTGWCGSHSARNCATARSWRMPRRQSRGPATCGPCARWPLNSSPATGPRRSTMPHTRSRPCATIRLRRRFRCGNG